MSQIFISYRRADSSGYGGRLQDELAERFGEAQVFRDVDTIRPGVDFAEVINQAVGGCDVFLSLIGRDWLTLAGPDGGRRLDNPEDFGADIGHGARGRGHPRPGGGGADAEAGRPSGAAGRPDPVPGHRAERRAVGLRRRPPRHPPRGGAGPDGGSRRPGPAGRARRPSGGSRPRRWRRSQTSSDEGAPPRGRVRRARPRRGGSRRQPPVGGRRRHQRWARRNPSAATRLATRPSSAPSRWTRRSGTWASR